MAQQTPQLRVPLRGELLVKLTQRFPTFDGEIIDLLNTIKSVSQIVNDKLAAELARYQLTEGRFFVLAYLYIEDMLSHPDPRPSDIAENLGVSRATITGLLDGLARGGLIQRNGNSGDRRMLTVAITDKAKQFLGEIIPGLTQTMQSSIDGALDPDERRILSILLAKVETHLNRAS